MTVKYNIISYLIGEGFKNVLKNKKSTGASLIIMSLIMLILGVCIIVSENINNIMNQIEVQQPMQVFIKKDATQSEIEALGEKIRKIDAVNSIEFISSEKALEINAETLKEEGNGVDLLEGWTEEDNPFRASYVVRLRDIKESKQVAELIGKYEKVGKVQMKDKFMDFLIQVSFWIKIFTIATVAVFIAISTFIIAYTIKLTVYARRREISIMKYVGATNSFIRCPFIVEGIIIGIISAFIAIILIGIIYTLFFNQINVGIGEFKISIRLLTFSEMFNLILFMYLILGAGIGAIGSIISMRKYLKV